MRFDNSEFFFQVSTVDPRHETISSARSEGMFAVSHQLIIDGGHVPKNWFKDRGGKDSFIELGVSMISSTKKLVTHRRVPLKVLLLYENEEQVANQNILSHSSDTKLQIDSTGRTYIRFRIGEVSRNHQKQSFCLKIGPDTHHCPLNNDISPVLSDSVEVLSKPRSGKDKKEDPSLNGKRKGIAEDTDVVNKKERTATTVFPGAPVPGLESSGITALLTAHTLAAKSTNKTTFPNQSPMLGTSTSQSGYTMNGRRLSDARVAFGDLMKWNKMVMDELLQLKWRQVGMERMPDGTMEPLVVRKNPNLAIDDLVQRYDFFCGCFGKKRPIICYNFKCCGAVVVVRYNEYAVPNMRMLYKDMFNVNDDTVIPDTTVRSEVFDSQGHSFDDMPPPNAPKLGMQHSLMSNPDDWPSVVFTPSLVEDLMATSEVEQANSVKEEAVKKIEVSDFAMTVGNTLPKEIPSLEKKGKPMSDEGVEVL